MTSYELYELTSLSQNSEESHGITVYQPLLSMGLGVFSGLICGRGKITAIVFWYEMHMDVEGWMCFPLGQICVREFAPFIYR